MNTTDSILIGDSLDVLKTFDDDSIGLIVTDPPYGYSFMGKNWDKAVPSVELWRECMRVLKPGAFAFVMSAPRSDVQAQMIVRMTEAGFRMDFTPIYWTYASGFPKAGNIGKLVDKRLGAEREVVGQNTFGSTSYNQYQEDGRKEKATGTRAITKGSSELEGSYGGFQPKPAVEVILVAMKPLSEKTFVDQALTNGKGITWLDDCRVPTGTPYKNAQKDVTAWSGNEWGANPQTSNGKVKIENGRFPANLLVSDDVLNDGVGRHRAGNKNGIVNGTKDHAWLEGNGYSRSIPNDSGSYSRYFDLDAWAKTLPFLIVPKASKREKDKGLENFEVQKPNYSTTYRPTADESGDKGADTPYAGTNRNGTMRNGHPTVKPLKLMAYLITLGSRENDVVLDPFVGSGTTCVAAKELGRKYIGIEREVEYGQIAAARVHAAEQDPQTRLAV